jgi:transcriptional regulator with XRE-family HTH domain
VSELVPLSEDIPNEARELATELRRFFQSLNVSVRRYATRCNYDPATVSRYLNGRRVPPWSFIQGLLTEVAEYRGAPIQHAALEVIRKLHRSALQASNKHLYAVQVLQDKLAEADKEHKRAELREAALLEAVEVRQRRIAVLEVETLELNSSLLEERDKSVILQKLADRIAPAEEELAKLREEVEELKAQLARAQELSEQAEARCEELEQQLREAEEAASSGQEVREQEQLKTALREAAEARSLAERLAEELKKVKSQSPSATQGASPPSERPTTRKPTPAEILIEAAPTRSPKELATDLVRLNLTDDMEEHRATNEIARSYPLRQLGEVALELDKISNSMARSFMLAIASLRSAEDIFTLIQEFGQHTIDRSNNFASDAINWFTRRHNWPDIVSLINLLRGASMEELAQLCIANTGSNQATPLFVATLKESSGNERDMLLQNMAMDRSDDKLIELCSALYSSDSPLLLEVFTAIAEHHPKRAEKLSPILEAVGITLPR